MWLFDDVRESEQYFLSVCPQVYSDDRLLDKIMLAFSRVPLYCFVYLFLQGQVEPYIYSYFIANGTLINWLIILALQSAIPLSSWSDYPACSLWRNSHIDDSVSTIVFVAAFKLSVKYQKSVIMGGESALSWTWDIMRALFAVAAVVSADFYLQLFNGYDIALGAVVGFVVGVAMSWVLVRVVRPNLATRPVRWLCTLAFKDNSQIATFWPPDHQPYMSVPTTTKTQFHSFTSTKRIK